MREKVNAFLTDLRLAGKSPKTGQTYAFALDKFTTFLESIGADVLAVNGQESRAFRNSLAASGMKPASINTCLSAVKSFYDYLVDDGQLKGNPIIIKKLRVKAEATLPGFLGSEDEAKVRAWTETKPDHIRLAFCVMLTAGLRVSEAAGLRSEDVQVNGRTYFLMVRGKGNKQRLAPMTDAETAHAVTKLAQERNGKGRLFGVTANTLQWHARECRLDTGVDFHSHRCRHTFATNLLRSGIPVDVVQEALGHSSIETTRRYAKTAPAALAALATH